MKKNHYKIKSFGCIALYVGMSLVAGCAHMSTSSKDKQKSKLYLQMAVDQLRNRLYSQSIDSTREAIKLNPEYAAAYNHLALVYMETKRYVKAETAFKQALSIREDYPEVFNNLGVLMNRQEKYKKSIQFFAKALKNELYSTPETAYTNMGYAYYKLGKLKRAKNLHRKALDIMPEFCLAKKNLADVYAKERNYRRASKDYRSAVTTCPLYQEAQYKLGLALMKMGQRKVARTAFEQLVEKHDKGPYVQRSQEVLKYLQ